MEVFFFSSSRDYLKARDVFSSFSHIQAKILTVLLKTLHVTVQMWTTWARISYHLSHIFVVSST